MAQQEIFTGNTANDGTGDTLLESFTKVNENFTEIYEAIGGSGNVGTLAPVLTVTSNLTATGNTLINSSDLLLRDGTDVTKFAQLDLGSISSGSTVIITVPDNDHTIVGVDLTQTLVNKTISGAVNTFSDIALDSAVTGVLPRANGGTGGLLTYAYGGTGVSTAPTDGQILIGNGSGFALATITAGSGIAILNTPGGIQIENTGGGGGGGGGSAISANNTSVLASTTSTNVGGTVTTTIDGNTAISANANLTTFSTSVQLKPGTTSRAPLVFPAGTKLTTPVSGAMEYDSTAFWITIGSTRKQVATYDQITSGAVTAFNTRTGNVTLTSTDVNTALGYTPLSSNTGGNVGGAITVFGNITTSTSLGASGYAVNTGNVVATGNITANNISVTTGIAGTLTTSAQTNITSVGTLTSLTVSGNINTGSGATTINSGITTTGNVTANYLIGNISGNLTGNITGTILTAAQPNITSVGTLTSLTVSGNINGNTVGTHTGAVVGNSSTATALQTARAINGTNFDGTADITVTANASTLTGTVLKSNVVTSSLTTVGNLSNLVVTGTITVNSGNNTTAIINGGTSGSGNIGASGATFNTVFAKATTAQYADLAEKYLADRNYDVGTVVIIGGEQEVTACSTGQRAIGAVSDKPAYMMNSELEGGTYIALKGRVPVKVTGSVTKGDRLVAGPLGTAVKATMAYYSDTFAIALESSSDENIKTIEAIIL